MDPLTTCPADRDEALRLVLADPDLLRAEFDAIVALSWPSRADPPSPPPGAPGAPAGLVPGSGRGRAGGPRDPVRGYDGAAEVREAVPGRERSPPGRPGRSGRSAPVVPESAHDHPQPP